MSQPPIGSIEDVYESISRQMQNASANATRMAEVSGRGEAADGRVVVLVGATGTLRSVELDPRAMRLPSADLATALVEAARAAEQDAAAQVAEIWGGPDALGGLDVAALMQGRGSDERRAEIEQRMDRARQALQQLRPRG